MGYNVKILDTLDDSHTTIIEHAAQSSVVLSWSGADAKDDLKIVGSSLAFTFVDQQSRDAHYSDLYTANETRYKVVIDDDDDVRIWSGHLLPEQYSEPYTKGNTFVGFTASDGLGRLKGKYFSDDWYGSEFSVISIISQCLAQTGLSLELFFSPAIENASQKYWHNIYVPTTPFISNSKKKDIHSIFEQLMNDMVCCVYQANNRWNVEGLNKRHFREVEYYRYDSDGNFIEMVSVVRNLKEAIAVPTPLVTIVSAYGSVIVSNDRAGISFPDDIIQQENEGWAVTAGVKGSVYARHWHSVGDIYPKCRYSDYYLSLPVSQQSGDSENYIELAQKLYVTSGEKLNFSAKFKITLYETTAFETVSDRKIEDDLSQMMKMELLIGDAVYLSDWLSFDDSGICEIDNDIISEYTGLLNVKLYTPYLSSFYANLMLIHCTEMNIEPIAFDDDEQLIVTVNDEFSVVKEHDLVFSDAYNGNENSFRLKSLNQKTDEFTTIQVPVLYGFIQNGLNYSVVELAGANLIENNIDNVKYNGTTFENLGVVYNYAKGEQMLIVTPALITSGNFDVDVYKYDDVEENREYWLQWTDSVYKIEKKRYASAVASVFQRMFAVAHPKIEMELKQSVKFNDFIRFPYITPSNYHVLNCSWDISNNISSVVVAKGFYQDSTETEPGDDISENIKPVVVVGGGVVLVGSQSGVKLFATAYDPDGFIAKYEWEIISGTGGVVVHPSNPDTLITGLWGNAYVVRCTVTDNDGATAFDEIEINRQYSYDVDLVKIKNDVQDYSTYNHRRDYEYQLIVDPDVDDSAVIKFAGTYNIKSIPSNGLNYAMAGFFVQKNGHKIIDLFVSNSNTDNNDFEFTFIKTDDVVIGIKAETRFNTEFLSGGTPPAAFAEFDILTYEFTASNGMVNGLPLDDQQINIEP